MDKKKIKIKSQIYKSAIFSAVSTVSYPVPVPVSSRYKKPTVTGSFFTEPHRAYLTFFPP
jgi:hypothetical protein